MAILMTCTGNENGNWLDRKAVAPENWKRKIACYVWTKDYCWIKFYSLISIFLFSFYFSPKRRGHVLLIGHEGCGKTSTIQLATFTAGFCLNIYILFCIQFAAGYSRFRFSFVLTESHWCALCCVCVRIYCIFRPKKHTKKTRIQ